MEDKVWIQTMEALLLLGSMHLTPRRRVAPLSPNSVWVTSVP